MRRRYTESSDRILVVDSGELELVSVGKERARQSNHRIRGQSIENHRC